MGHEPIQALDAESMRKAEIRIAFRQQLLSNIKPSVDGILFGNDKKYFELGFWKARDEILFLADELLREF